jgi:hypothetical protein
MIKMKGCMEKSVDIMSAMNDLVNVKEVSATMRDMAREMERVSLSPHTVYYIHCILYIV